MLIAEFKKRLGISEEEYNSLATRFELLDKFDIDDDFANTIIESILMKNEYRNNSSLLGVEIEGLFNKYTYKITFDQSINIFVAENGHGKTTIIKIIVAALKGDAHAISNLPFTKVILFFRDKEPLIIEKEKIRINKGRIRERFRVINSSTQKRKIYNDDGNSFENEIIYSMLMKKIMYSYNRFFSDIGNSHNVSEDIWFHRKVETLREYRELNTEEKEFIQKMFFKFVKENHNTPFENLKKFLQDEVMYLPTFRRVEAELSDFSNERLEHEELFSKSNLKFGLKDVGYRINQLTTQLTSEAFETHSKINGEILGDLLSDNPLKIDEQQRNEITQEKINIITGRIGQENIKEYVKLSSFINNLHNNDYEHENKDFLEYYLYKLIKIYDSQKIIDNKIKAFKDVCNKYLINKQIVFDEISPKIKIIDNEDGNTISLLELSSGEKQILSIFSELYLEEHKSIIYIIDEPELSLSIVWQKEILKDIYNSGKVSLLISTTHSPFIYKNDYKIFAKDLGSYKSKYNTNHTEWEDDFER